MIKFFRRIRQRLLTENKFTRYLLYAIGEIILVVIGILIALQVNTWNEGRILKEKEKEYLTDIRAFLLEDKKDVDELLEFYDEKQKVYDSLLTRLDAKYTLNDFLSPFTTYMLTTADAIMFTIKSTAFDNMLSANDIGIISDKSLRYKLSSYYSQDPLFGTQDRLKRATREFRDYVTLSTVTKQNLDAWFKANTLAPDQNDIEDFRTKPEFYQILFNTTVSISNEISYLNRQKELIDELIEDIEKELPD